MYMYIYEAVSKATANMSTVDTRVIVLLSIMEQYYGPHLHDLVPVHSVIPGGGCVCPDGLGREEQELLETQVLCHVCPDEGLVVALGEVGEGVGGVGLVVDTLQVQICRFHIAQISVWETVINYWLSRHSVVHSEYINLHANGPFGACFMYRTMRYCCPQRLLHSPGVCAGGAVTNHWLS